MFIEIAVPVLTAVSAATIGWVVQISSRITKVETKQEDLPELIKAQFAGLEPKFDSISHRLTRIESAMNGTLYGKH